MSIFSFLKDLFHFSGTNRSDPDDINNPNHLLNPTNPIGYLNPNSPNYILNNTAADEELSRSLNDSLGITGTSGFDDPFDDL